MGYIQVILTACIVFPILAFIITLPYVIYNYNKYGSVLLARTFLIYGFILYLLSAYFLVILPLPDVDDVLNIKLNPQIIPFNFIKEIITYSTFSITNPRTYLAFLKEPWVYQTIYNLLLTMPFAIFLRYYFNCNFRKTIFMTFLLSLFFELTQLTGLYFIYPNAYRLFDVDDLIVNTLGGVVGYLITPLIKKLLPNKKELDLKSYKKGIKVSTTKRIITFIIDLIFIVLLFIIIFIISKILDINYSYYVYIVGILFFIFIIIPLLNGGATIGGMITNIKIASKDGSQAKWYQILLRNLLLSYVMLPIFYYLKLLLEYINVITNNSYKLIISVAYLFLMFIFGLFIIIRNFILHKSFMYEILTKTKIISTIKLPDSKKALTSDED